MVFVGHRGGEAASVNYLEYIQGTGTQYINTGVYPNQNTMARLGINMQAITGDVILGHMGGAIAAQDDKDWRFFSSSGAYYLDIMQSRLSGGSYPLNTRMDFEVGNNYLKNITTGENILSGSPVSAFSSELPIFLFYGVLEIAKGMVYYLQIYDNGTLIRDYRPAKDPSGAVCLYDQVNRQYVYNAGTGVFTAGPEL